MSGFSIARALGSNKLPFPPHYPPPNYCGPYMGAGFPVSMLNLEYTAEHLKDGVDAPIYCIQRSIAALTTQLQSVMIEIQQLLASSDSIKSLVELLGEEMILQREEDEEAKKKDAVEANSRSEEVQCQILTLMEKEKENTNSLVEMVDNLGELLNVVGS